MISGKNIYAMKRTQLPCTDFFYFFFNSNKKCDNILHFLELLNSIVRKKYTNIKHDKTRLCKEYNQLNHLINRNKKGGNYLTTMERRNKKQ